jgi:hypothetical protein
MNLHDAAPQHHGATAATTTRLSGCWLVVVRVAWGAAVILTLGLFVLSLPARFAVLSLSATAPRLGQLSTQEAARLEQLGFPSHFYAWYELFWTVAPVLVFGTVASIIVWRKSNDWVALLVGLTLWVLACMAPPAMASLVDKDPMWRVPVAVVQSVGLALIFYLFCVFPNGHFAPRTMRWLAVIWTTYVVTRVFVPALDQPFYLSGVQTAADLVVLLWMSAWFAAGLAAQLYRYRYVSTPMERQQTKWVVFAFAAMLAILGVAGLLLQVFPSLRQPGTGHLFYQLLVIPLAVCALTLLPLSFGFAILHSHLWDIDILINRTLVYSVLTALLGGVYALSIVVLQGAVRLLTGQIVDLAVVASTLAIAALFQPLRRRIQQVIDRRFYRRKYDAQKTLQTFSARLREETNLDTLSDDLIAVVQDTMQPAYVSLWLCEPGREGQR